MCSRFEQNAAPGDLAKRFGMDGPPPVSNMAELRPTDLSLIITPGGPRMLTWGLRVEWDAKPLINARAETLAAKKSFRELLENRCLVPATAYFEWRKDSGAKLKNRIGIPGDTPFAFAGLFDGDCFTIITTAPAPAIAHIHGRMPVMLDTAGEAQWIDPDAVFADVAGLLAPHQSAPLKAEEDTPLPPRQPDLFG